MGIDFAFPLFAPEKLPLADCSGSGSDPNYSF